MGRCIVELERIYSVRNGSAGKSDPNYLGGDKITIQKDLANIAVTNALGLKVDTLNNNLATYLYKYYMAGVNGIDLTTIQNTYDNYSSTFADSTYYRFTIQHAVSYNILGGGRWYVEGFKTGNSFEFQVAKSYEVNGIREFVRSKYNGTWNSWGSR